MWSQLSKRLKNSLIFCFIGILSFSSLINLFSVMVETSYAFTITSTSSSAKPGGDDICSESDNDKCRTVRVCTTNNGCEDHKFASVEDDNAFVVDIQPDDPDELYAMGKNVTVKNGENSITVYIPDGDFGSGITFLVEDKNGKNVLEKAYTGTTASGGESAGTTTNENPDDAEENLSCSNAAGGLGWIACSVISLISNFIDYFYNEFLSNFLTIEPGLLNTENGTYKAWSAFRDMANIVFVIFLLVVIFSQITGVGIDNYGIKKSLPKLITAAILVNLSYFICQLAVDVSNIVGTSLMNFLDTINIVKLADIEGINGSNVAITIGEFGVTAGIVGIMVAASGVAAPVWAIAGISSMFIGFAATLIAAAVSFLFMFFLLSVRQALVVVLVALAPLALVCYMLPNTKKIFDRWLSMGKAMLLLFPACSLAMGGGHLAARIIMSSTAQANLFMVLTAMIAEIAPFFFIPSMVRGAYSAFGKLGTEINKMSGGLSKGARGAFLGGRFARNMQKGAELRRAAGIDAAYKKSIARKENARTPLGRTLGQIGTRDSMKDRTMEARKQLAALEAYKNERELWTGENKKKSNGENIEDVNGNIITQGEATFNATIKQAQIGADAKAQNAIRMNTPLYQNATAAALARKDLDENIRSMESLISNNNYAYQENNGRVVKVDPNDLNGLGEALKRALVKEGDNSVEISALVNYLSRQGENGHVAVYKAISDASDSGELNDDARRSFSSNIMQYHASDYKNNMRSVFDYASGNTGDIKMTAARYDEQTGDFERNTDGSVKMRQKTFKDYVAQSADSLKQEQFVSMDEHELSNYLKAIQASETATDPLSAEALKLVNVGDYSTIQEAKKENDRRVKVVKELAYKTLANPELAGGFKEKQKRIVEQIASNYAPAASIQERNDSIAASDEARTDESRNNVIHGNYSTHQDAVTSGIKFATQSYDDGTTMITPQNYDQYAGTISRIQDGYLPSPDLKNFTVQNNDEGNTQLVAHDDEGNVTCKFDPATGRHVSPKEYSITDDKQQASAQHPQGREAVTRTVRGYNPLPELQNRGRVTNRRWDENPGREHILHIDHTPTNGQLRHLEINTKTGLVREVNNP